MKELKLHDRSKESEQERLIKALNGLSDQIKKIMKHEGKEESNEDVERGGGGRETERREGGEEGRRREDSNTMVDPAHVPLLEIHPAPSYGTTNRT